MKQLVTHGPHPYVSPGPLCTLSRVIRSAAERIVPGGQKSVSSRLNVWRHFLQIYRFTNILTDL